MRLSRKLKKLENEGLPLPEGLEYVAGKTKEEIFTMEKKLNKELGSVGMHYWFKSQFWQLCSNAIFFVFIFNLVVLKNITLISASTIVYLCFFFMGKFMSPMYVKMYLRQISRENNALKEKEPQIDKTA
jgi:hypothetical protein